MNTIQDQLAAAEAANNTGNYAEAETLCRKLLAQDLRAEEKATILLVLSQSLWQRGLAKDALPFAKEGLLIAEKVENKELQVRGLGNIGIIYSYAADYVRSLEYLHKALAINEELGNKSGVARILSSIGNVYSLLSDYPRALEHYHQAHAIYEELDNKSALAINLGNIGNVYEIISDYINALENYKRSLSIFEGIGNKDGVAFALGNIGTVYQGLADHSRALEYYQQALLLEEELGNKNGIGANLGNIGNIYKDLLNYSDALKYLQQAKSIFDELGNKRQAILTIGVIGSIYLELSDYDRALEYLHKAVALNKEIGEKSGVVQCLYSLGRIYAKQDFASYNLVVAEEYFLQAMELNQELNIRKTVLLCSQALADLYQQQERWQAHAEYLRKYYETEKELQIEETKKIADKFAFERQIAVMEKEREVTDMLLHKFLPSPIVNEVKAKEGKILVQQFNSISVLFADLVGFTKLSLSIKPEIMIEMLNFIFTKFDTIVKEAGGHRLRTIGDGYFAICGAPDLVENHQYKLAKAALKFMEDIILPENIRKHLPEGTVLDIRIGLHCGEAVCGMVGGLEKWQYDAYGDTINTTSRMESHGEAGKIHISEDFKHALAEYGEFTFLPREPMFIKGKGMMNTYFLQ